MVYLQNNIIKNLKYEKDQIGILEVNNVTEIKQTTWAEKIWTDRKNNQQTWI